LFIRPKPGSFHGPAAPKTTGEEEDEPPEQAASRERSSSRFIEVRDVGMRDR
jgi:hypothetical protein